MGERDFLAHFHFVNLGRIGLAAFLLAQKRHLSDSLSPGRPTEVDGRVIGSQNGYISIDERVINRSRRRRIMSQKSAGWASDARLPACLPASYGFHLACWGANIFVHLCYERSHQQGYQVMNQSLNERALDEATANKKSTVTNQSSHYFQGLSDARSSLRGNLGPLLGGPHWRRPFQAALSNFRLNWASKRARH